MDINPMQRKVLAGCAAVVVMMLLYPPLHFRGIGRGYGWIFAMDHGLTVNASQLIVQWIAVGIVGGIAFVLSAHVAPSARTRSGPTIGQIMNHAFRTSRHWLWILLAMIAASVAMSPSVSAATLNGMGKLGAAIVLYSVIFLWHCNKARTADTTPPARRPVSWARIAAGVIVAGALLAGFVWYQDGMELSGGGSVRADDDVRMAKPSGSAPRAASEGNYFDRFDPAAPPRK